MLNLSFPVWKLCDTKSQQKPAIIRSPFRLLPFWLHESHVPLISNKLKTVTSVDVCFPLSHWARGQNKTSFNECVTHLYNHKYFSVSDITRGTHRQRNAS